MVVGQADEMWRRLKRKFGQALSAKASSGAARESTTTLGGMFGEQTSRWHTGATENATLERVGCIAPTSRTAADLDAMADALRCSGVFLRLEDELLDIVAAATTWEVLAPDEVVCDEQSVDSTVLLVVRGKLSVLTRDRDSVAVYDLGPGDTFSDYSADSRRNVASVSASSDNVALLQLLTWRPNRRVASRESPTSHHEREGCRSAALGGGARAVGRERRGGVGEVAE